MIKLLRKWFTRSFKDLLWYHISVKPDRPCKIVIYNRDKGTGTSYNYNGKNWNFTDSAIVWTHVPIKLGQVTDEQNVKL